jgi:superfamily II DNA helicase RecQ
MTTLQASYFVTTMINIRKEVVAILSVVKAFDGNYATQDLEQILQGEVPHTPGFCKPDEGGRLSGVHPRRLRNLINYLVHQGFLAPELHRAGKLRVTGYGHRFLEYPSDLRVSCQELSNSQYDTMLWQMLQGIRQEICETDKLPPFRVLTDYAIQRVVQDRPCSEEALRQIPGLGAFKVNKFGKRILEAVAHVKNIQQQETPL